MTIQFTNVFHTGYVVDDIAAAMEELGEALQIRWARVQRREMRLRTPEGPTTIDLTYTYSGGDEPPHVELLERIPGSLWDVSTGPGRLHHLGLWSDDLIAESQQLTALGAPLQATFETPDQAVSGFAYHRMPSGVLVELVDSGARLAMQRWLSEPVARPQGA